LKQEGNAAYAREEYDEALQLYWQVSSVVNEQRRDACISIPERAPCWPILLPPMSTKTLTHIVPRQLSTAATSQASTPEIIQCARCAPPPKHCGPSTRPQQ
jgi:hypothetical protein